MRQKYQKYGTIVGGASCTVINLTKILGGPRSTLQRPHGFN